jgi:hypothetical protein
MNEKPTRWEYITTIIVLLLCTAWAWYDYKNDPNKIPFEPLIAVVGYTIVLLGYLRWKKDKEEADKIYNINSSKNAHFDSSVKDSKNVVNNSSFNVGGNLNIGDTTVHTESKTSRNLRIFWNAFGPILLIAFVFFYYKTQKLSEPLYLTVQIADATPNPNIPFEKAKITLTYGDKTESQTVEKEAIFKGISPSFRDANVQIVCEAEGFVSVQRVFALSENAVTIPLRRDNSLATIFGQIKDEKGYALADVQVKVQDIIVVSNASGTYSLPIPFEKQLKTQRITAFKKGYKPWDYETPVISGTPVNMIMKK